MKKRTTVSLSAALMLGLCAQMTLSVPAVEAGELRTAVIYDITTMDVAKTSDNYLVPMNVFDRLFETRLVDGTAQVVNSLCTEYAVSEDGLTYDFTLRDDVVFSNGNPLTASDVAYSFARLLVVNQDNTDIPNEIVGSDDITEGKSETLSGVTVADDTHLTVTLKAPNAGFLAELSAPAMSIVDEETMKEVKNFGTEPADTIGSGPYVVTEWVANDHYSLAYNDKYWGEEPSVKAATVNIIPDASTQNLMFQNGELDLIDLQSLDSAIVDSTYKTTYEDQIVSTPKVGMTYLLLNEDQQYLQDVKVRQAIGMAIDVDTIITGIFNGDATPEHGIIPTGIWGHNDDLEGFTYDPEAAKALLEEAGYKDGEVTFEIALDSDSDSSTTLMIETISEMLKEVGITANIKSYEHSAWLDLRNSGEMESFLANWGMDYNDPANIMYTFFGNAANAKTRSLNYKDTDVMQRVSDVRAIVDDTERMEEYQAIEKKIITEDAAWIPLLAKLHLYCIGDRVESFTPHWAGFSDFYLSDVVLK